jgi:hypothetical protein
MDDSDLSARWNRRQYRTMQCDTLDVCQKLLQALSD